MKLRDDINPATTWVYSDTHYGHDNIVGFCHRPEDHEQVMIAEWRKVALPGRTMLHLGDLVYRGNARFKAITAKELTGEGMADRNLLIRGNHDGQRRNYYLDCGFRWVLPFGIPLIAGADGLEVFEDALSIAKLGDKEYAEFMAAYGAYTISFSHYAWSADDERGVLRTDHDRIGHDHWRLHGHIHNNGYQRSDFVPFLRNHINVSVEQVGYKPVNLKTLLDAAILGLLPATQEEENELASIARQRSIARRTERKVA